MEQEKQSMVRNSETLLCTASVKGRYQCLYHMPLNNKNNRLYCSDKLLLNLIYRPSLITHKFNKRSPFINGTKTEMLGYKLQIVLIF